MQISAPTIRRRAHVLIRRFVTPMLSSRGVSVFVFYRMMLFRLTTSSSVVAPDIRMLAWSPGPLRSILRAFVCLLLVTQLVFTVTVRLFRVTVLQEPQTVEHVSDVMLVLLGTLTSDRKDVGRLAQTSTLRLWQVVTVNSSRIDRSMMATVVLC